MKTENKVYSIQCAETGTVIETGLSLDEANAVFAKFEATDMVENQYTPGFYEIVEIK